MRRLRGLSVKQPFAEQIMRGTKKFEYRSCPTTLKSPKRLRNPVEPQAHPQPVWFYPFGR